MGLHHFESKRCGLCGVESVYIAISREDLPDYCKRCKAIYLMITEHGDPREANCTAQGCTAPATLIATGCDHGEWFADTVCAGCGGYLAEHEGVEFREIVR